jgi:PGF-pre-PGF domain-containing protein
MIAKFHMFILIVSFIKTALMVEIGGKKMFYRSKLLLTVTLAVLMLSSLGLSALTIVTPAADTIDNSTIVFNATNNSEVFNNTPVTYYYKVNNTLGTAGAWTSLGIATMDTVGAVVVGFSLSFDTTTLTDGNYTFNISNATSGDDLDTDLSAMVYINNIAFTVAITGGTGTVATTSTTLTATTDENATCKWDTTALAFGSMTNNFDTTGGTSHSTTATGSFGVTKNMFVGCQSSWYAQISDYNNASSSFFPAASGGVVVPQYRKLGGITPSASVQQTTIIGSIGEGATGTVTVTKSELGVKTIEISVNTPVSNVQISVKKLASAPASVTKTVSGTVYKYLDISASGVSSSQLDTVKISFAVPKAWFTANNIAMSTVALNHWTGSDWETLSTTQTTSDDANYYFEATSSGFSPYAITGTTQQVATPTTPSTDGTGGTPQPQPVIPIADAGDNTMLYVIVGLVIVVAAYFLLRGRKQ